MKNGNLTVKLADDKRDLDLSQFTKARTADEAKYDQLIYAVERKFPGESRFETALRYITTIEKNSRTGSAGCATEVGYNVKLSTGQQR
jgi:hypothetical protein